MLLRTYIKLILGSLSWRRFGKTSRNLKSFLVHTDVLLRDTHLANQKTVVATLHESISKELFSCAKGRGHGIIQFRLRCLRILTNVIESSARPGFAKLRSSYRFFDSKTPRVQSRTDHGSSPAHEHQLESKPSHQHENSQLNPPSKALT